jgi:hypothetical protein
MIDKAPPPAQKARRETQVGQPSPDWLPLGTVCVGATVEASFAVYTRADDPKKVPLKVNAPPFVKVLDQSVIDRTFYEGDERVKGVAGIVVLQIDTSKPGVFQGQVEVKLGAAMAKVPVAVVVKPPEPAAVKILVVESPFHWNATGDPGVFKDWTDLVAEAGWDVSYLTAAHRQPLFRDLDLSKFNVVLLDAGGLTTEGNAEDLKRARAFPEGGGQLVLAANRFYSGSVEAANKVLDGYGLKMLNEEAPIGPKRFIPAVVLDKESFAPEVVKAGINSARFHRASPLVVSADKPARVLIKAVDIGGPQDGYVATAKVGKGEVVVLGQSLWWSWMSADQAKGTDNAKLFRLLLTPAAEKLRK